MIGIEMEYLVVGLASLELILMFPIGYLYSRTTELSRKLDMIQTTHYDKAEVKEAIELRIDPIKLSLGNVEKDIHEIKTLLTKALNRE